jgi:hypothetical protein
MFRKKKDLTPLTIIVGNGRWDAIGNLTPRNQWLYSVLQNQGGINESVEDGLYHFNVKREGFKLKLTLDKIEN